MTAVVTSADSRNAVEIVRDGFERLLNQRDADVLQQFWADDIIEEFPFETLRGKAAVKKYFADTFAALPDFNIQHVRSWGKAIRCAFAGMRPGRFLVTRGWASKPLERNWRSTASIT